MFSLAKSRGRVDYTFNGVGTENRQCFVIDDAWREDLMWKKLNYFLGAAIYVFFWQIFAIKNEDNFGHTKVGVVLRKFNP